MAAAPCRVADLPGLLVVIARHCLRDFLPIGCEDLDILSMTSVRAMNGCETCAQSDNKAEMPVCTKDALLVQIELCELIAAVTFREPS